MSLLVSVVAEVPQRLFENMLNLATNYCCLRICSLVAGPYWIREFQELQACLRDMFSIVWLCWSQASDMIRTVFGLKPNAWVFEGRDHVVNATCGAVVL